jgi:molecular chaperone DnaK (HSP70)
VSDVRFSIGIDLGTTNCAISFVSGSGDDAEEIRSQVMPIEQLIAPGSIEERQLLPSFLYMPHPDEFASADLALPWRDRNRWIAGELARARGIATPLRLVSSAKSWLCNPSVDRRAAILP